MLWQVHECHIAKSDFPNFLMLPSHIALLPIVYPSSPIVQLLISVSRTAEPLLLITLWLLLSHHSHTYTLCWFWVLFLGALHCIDGCQHITVSQFWRQREEGEEGNTENELKINMVMWFSKCSLFPSSCSSSLCCQKLAHGKFFYILSLLFKFNTDYYVLMF